MCRQYVDCYFENVMQIACCDFYPLMKSAAGENYIRDMYYYNYELMAERCKGTMLALGEGLFVIPKK